MVNFTPRRFCALALIVYSGCAQAPTAELALTTLRIEAAREADAAIFASEPLNEAELALATAQSLVDDRGYRDAVHSAAEAVRHADNAFETSTVEKSIAQRRFNRCLNELEGLMAIARSRGAASVAPDEFAAFAERYEAIKAVAESGDLLTALEQGRHLEPELLAFERKFRD